MKQFLMRSSFLIFCLLASEAKSQQRDSVFARVAPEYDTVGIFRRFWFGDSYRKLYNTPVEMRILHLGEEHGGLSVVKLGGGMQTQSLRLVDAQGREWVLRSIQKYPERSLPENLRHTIVKDIVQDQISITHPFGALTVPPFNVALDIPHASPELVFVGDDEHLGEYRSIFKNRPYMFEPRMPFEDSKTDNTQKVIRKALADNDTQIEQRLTLRARLLDMILGDWDRHEDNWRWDPEKEKGKRIYTPVPRDRDKVYYKTSGVLPVLLSKQWLKAHLQPFSPHIRNVSHWNFNARHFDRFFLTHLDEKDWKKEIKFMQKTLSDSLIEGAIAQMPDTIVALSGGELIHNIKSRRDELNQIGIDYYHALARVIDIPLSAKNEFVDLDYNKDGSISLKVLNKKKDGSEGRELIKRKFTPNETKELRIYGIDGEDVYNVHGSGKSPIKVRVIGGKGYDNYTFKNNFRNGRRLFLYEDSDRQANDLDLKQGIRYRLKKDTAVHNFVYDAFAYDRRGMLVDLNYGVDRGLIFGLGYIIENQGFRKKGYATKHIFKASYLTGRESFILGYDGAFRSIVGEQDLLINVESEGPRNLANFFGFGNETRFEKGEGKGIRYYRNRYDLASAEVLLDFNPVKELHIKYGSLSTFYNSSEEANNGRFFQDFHASQPDVGVFGTKFFTGASVSLDYDSRDQKDNAKKGIHWLSKLHWQGEIGGDQRNHVYLSNAFSFYKSLFNERFVFANRTGLDAVWGNPYFFQYAQLGGERNLRGYNSRRFTGNTMAYNNAELRAKLFSFDSYLVPGTVGLIGFYDIGRVWEKNERSKTWHQGYGGGLYLIPADLMVIQAAWGISKEAVLPYINIGLRF
ncbi:BamA/TamA family outer membrane protein [Sphingobacterium sp. LRF_L2]|uniref:BamA/TamA family outer membrane protein n=1 Tax=Sphingobacterium sp. LRF_L2 TaxID=3369421 RepID=UPI003F625849